MKQGVFRLLMGLVFALPLALVSFAFSQADTAEPTPTPPPAECRDCHESFQTAWEAGAHGQAMTDPAFQAAWEAQKKPKDCLACHTTGFDPATGAYDTTGVTCGACHDPVAALHPLAPASMSRKADLCGECHQDTYFEWQASEHGRSNLTCVSCHDPHATTTRAEDAELLCASCHSEKVTGFMHSTHAEEGLACTDCHVGQLTQPDSLTGQARHSHTFAVNLETCTQCHATQIHTGAGTMATAPNTPVPPDSMNSGQPRTASAEPQPVGPLGFAIVAGLIGLAFGLVMAPWLERGFRRFTQTDKPQEMKL